MIDELKYLLDANENNPKLKDICLKIAGLSEENQYRMLEVIKIMLRVEK